MNERKTLTLNKQKQATPMPEVKPKKVFGKIPFSEQVDGLDKLVMEYIENKTELVFSFLDGTNMHGVITERDKYGFRIDDARGISMTIFKHSLKLYYALPV